MLDLALVQQLAEGADGLGVRHLRVRPVELVEPDGLDAEPLEGCLAGRPQVLGAAVEHPAPVAGAEVAALGGDQHRREVAAQLPSALAISVSLCPTSPASQVVGVGGVDEGHTGVQRGVDRARGSGPRPGGPRSTWACRRGRWR